MAATVEQPAEQLDCHFTEFKAAQVQVESKGDKRAVSFLGMTTRPSHGYPDLSRFDPQTFRAVIERHNARIQEWKAKRGNRPVKVLDHHTDPALVPLGFKSNRGKVGFVERIEVVDLGYDAGLKENVMGAVFHAITFDPHFNALLDNDLVDKWSPGWKTLAKSYVEMPGFGKVKVMHDWDLDHVGGLDDPADDLTKTLAVEARSKKVNVMPATATTSTVEETERESKSEVKAKKEKLPVEVKQEEEEAEQPEPEAEAEAEEPEMAEEEVYSADVKCPNCGKKAKLASLAPIKGRFMAYKSQIEALSEANLELKQKVKELSDEKPELKERVEELELELKQRNVDALVEREVKSGHLTPKQVEPTRTLLMGLNKEGIKQWQGAMAEAPNLTGVGVEVKTEAAGEAKKTEAQGKRHDVSEFKSMLPPSTASRIDQSQKDGFDKRKLRYGVVIPPTR